jgi:hypothetical protein
MSRLLHNTPHHMWIENWCCKWCSATTCGFLVLVIPSQVNWASSVNRILCGICSCGCSHTRNCTQLAWVVGKRCCTLWRWCGQKPSQWKILHTCVYATPVALGILHVLILGLCCTAARTSSPCHHSCSAFAHEQEPVSIRVTCMQSRCFAMHNSAKGYHCQYSTTTALPFPLQKLYKKYMSAFWICKMFQAFWLCPHCNTTQLHYLDSVQAGTQSSYSISYLLH